ncbi:YlbF family regulator [Streptococcaceae bacterium ESL0687]|nr:YlbF family regulator [Streptococcaceae bacterium ESL0687]
MLIVNESLAKIDDVIDKIVASFLSFDQVNNYKKAQADFEADIFLQEQLKDLLEKNQLLAENEAYLPYRPELKELQREIRGLQREVNLNEHVYKLRLAENDLQGLLADLTRDIAATISEDISIDEGLPFSKKGHHGRGESCGS